jgi:hypothetical protein
MYDMAKRSLAFTVATGGLLLTGTGYAPADAAVGFGTLPGPAQAQGSAAANQASPTSVSTPISVSGPEAARAAVPVIAPKRVHVLTPQDPRSAGSGAAAAASSTVKDSPGILSGNTVQIPIYLGLNMCSDQAGAGAIHNDVAGSTCGGSGAVGGSNAGSSATASTTHSGGILSGNTVQAPINIPLNACGKQAVLIGSHNQISGGTCGTGGSGSGGNSGGANATAVTDHSGGILSGNIIQAPVNVPVSACGDQVDAIALHNKTGGTNCTTGTGGSGPGGANATAVTNHSGGIGSGITLQAPINAPVNACGDQVIAVGFRNSDGAATCSLAAGGTSALSATMNSGGIASAISGQLPINVPVEACGDQVGAGTFHDTTDAPTCIGPTAPTSTEVSYVSNSGGVLSGNQASLPINVPVIACGDQISAVGVGNTTGTPTCSPTPPVPTPSSSVTPSTSPTPICDSCGTPTPTVTPSMSASGTPTPITCPACASGTPSPTKTTPGGNTMPPGGPGGSGAHPAPGSLAHTGGAEGIALAVGAGALLVGAGVRTASKRRSGGNRSH